MPTREQIEDLIITYRDGLLKNVMPFWLENGWDREFGGIISSLDECGKTIDTDKSVWAQGRTAWMLGELLNHPLCSDCADRELWLEAGQSILGFIERHCIDADDGRMWFHVTREGKPIRKRRYSFSESFAAIAFGEFARATGNSHYQEMAERLFRNFIEHSQNVQSKFTETRPVKSIGYPMIALVTAQQLRDSIGLDLADDRIEDSIEEIQSDFCRPDIECVMETVDMQGALLDHFDGRLLNPVHAIEAAWFAKWEGRSRQEDSMIELGCSMLDWMWQRGWDQEYGGLLYFVDLHGKPVQEYWHDMKFWWPQNEAIIANLLAYQLTNDEKYFDRFLLAHDWAHAKFPDPQGQEWFGYLHRDGRVSTRLKGNMWKSPFHIPRMQLTCWQLLEEAKGEFDSGFTKS